MTSRKPATAPESPTPESSDPFDVERLRITDAADIGVSKVMLTVPVRRPNRAEFFRVNPDPDMCVDWFVIEHDTEGERAIYWITQDFRAELFDEARPVRIFVCINKRGTVFLWPAKLPTESQGGRRWAESGLEIAAAAGHSWVKMVGNRDLGAYEMFKARGDLGNPVWPDKALRELLALAFKGDLLINRDDHPVLRDLAGEM